MVNALQKKYGCRSPFAYASIASPFCFSSNHLFVNAIEFFQSRSSSVWIIDIYINDHTLT
jgi:hypothetical protein